MGQLIRLSNKIIENKNPIIEKEIENSANWKEYVETILAEANQREKVNFGGRDPRAPITPEEDVRLELPVRISRFRSKEFTVLFRALCKSSREF